MLVRRPGRRPVEWAHVGDAKVQSIAVLAGVTRSLELRHFAGGMPRLSWVRIVHDVAVPCPVLGLLDCAVPGRAVAGLVARARGAAIAPQVLGDVRAVAGGDYFRTAFDAANAKRGCELRNCCVVVNARV